MTTTTLAPEISEAVRNLLKELNFRTWQPGDGPLAPHLTTCWVTRVDVRRYGLIVPAMYGALDWLRLVNETTVTVAWAHQLIRLGKPQPMPPYNYGGPRYGWRTIQPARTVTLTERGEAVCHV